MWRDHNYGGSSPTTTSLDNFKTFATNTYLGNLRTLGNKEAPPQVAVILRDLDHFLPADGSGFEHGSITSMLRAWASDSPFHELPFTSVLIADNLNDVEPLLANSPHATRVRLVWGEQTRLDLRLVEVVVR